jgi:hypothetical protein
LLQYSSGIIGSDTMLITFTIRTENVMGILDVAGEIAGAVVAVEGAEKLDPNAGLLTKGVAAFAGFKGAGALESLVGKKEDEGDSNEAAPDADAAPQA